MSWIQETLSRKKRRLAQLLEVPLAALADTCAEAWPQTDRIDACLMEGIQTLPYCDLLYVLNLNARQLSSNVSPAGVDRGRQGQDLTGRPYVVGDLPYRGLVLSGVYLSHRNLKPSITALHSLRRGDNLVGFLAADFALEGLPLPREEVGPQAPPWTQFRGDPAIRGTLFLQERAMSPMDRRLSEVLQRLTRLMAEHGVFHGKVHFSSSRVTLWQWDDPFVYQIHSLEEILDPGLFLIYPRQAFPSRARVSVSQLIKVFDQFRALRRADETLYLRSASINLINAMVGLTFSCDGSHYMSVEEFLERSLSLWLGNQTCEPQAG